LVSVAFSEAFFVVFFAVFLAILLAGFFAIFLVVAFLRLGAVDLDFDVFAADVFDAVFFRGAGVSLMVFLAVFLVFVRTRFLEVGFFLALGDLGAFFLGLLLALETAFLAGDCFLMFAFFLGLEI
jgi:hypothetical protein